MDVIAPIDCFPRDSFYTFRFDPAIADVATVKRKFKRNFAAALRLEQQEKSFEVAVPTASLSNALSSTKTLLQSTASTKESSAASVSESVSENEIVGCAPAIDRAGDSGIGDFNFDSNNECMSDLASEMRVAPKAPMSLPSPSPFAHASASASASVADDPRSGCGASHGMTPMTPLSAPTLGRNFTSKSARARAAKAAALNTAKTAAQCTEQRTAQQVCNEEGDCNGDFNCDGDVNSESISNRNDDEKNRDVSDETDGDEGEDVDGRETSPKSCSSNKKRKRHTSTILPQVSPCSNAVVAPPVPSTPLRETEPLPVLRKRLGPFSYDAPRNVHVKDPLRGTIRAFVGLSASEVQLLKELVDSGFCTPEHLKHDVIDVLDEKKRQIPLRYLDFFCTNIAKGKPMLYDHRRRDGSVVTIDPHVSYKNMVRSYNRKLFDSFKREGYVYFFVDGVEHATTVGQLNWAHWLFNDGILKYVKDHVDDIRIAMKSVSDSRKQERSATGKRKRKAHLTQVCFGGRTVDFLDTAETEPGEDAEAEAGEDADADVTVEVQSEPVAVAVAVADADVEIESI